MREFVDAEGAPWRALVTEHAVAHGRRGTRLAFQPTHGEDVPPLATDVTFNSVEAGEFAVRTMSEKELKRRLAIARATARADEHTLPPTT